MTKDFSWESRYIFYGEEITITNSVAKINHGDFSFSQKPDTNHKFSGFGAYNGRNDCVVDSLFRFLYYHNSSELERILDTFSKSHSLFQKREIRERDLDNLRQSFYGRFDNTNLLLNMPLSFTTGVQNQSYRGLVNNDLLEIYSLGGIIKRNESEPVCLINSRDVEQIFFQSVREDFQIGMPFEKFNILTNWYLQALNNPTLLYDS